MNPDWAPCGRCDCVDGISPIPNKWEIDGVLRTNECPRRSLPKDADMIAQLFHHYQAGHLWVAGGVSDQPAVYLEMMSLIKLWIDKLTPS